MQAAEAVQVNYEELPAAISIAEAIAPDAPPIWSDIPGNYCFTYDAGDVAGVDRALERAAHVVRHTFETNRIVNCQLEPRSAIGIYNSGTEEYCLISGNQGVTKLQMSIAPALGVTKEKLRVICPDVGGGFGPRTYVYSEQVIVLWVARRSDGRALDEYEIRSIPDGLSRTRQPHVRNPRARQARQGARLSTGVLREHRRADRCLCHARQCDAHVDDSL